MAGRREPKTTATALDHCFKTCVGPARQWHIGEEKGRRFDEPRNRFITGLNEAIKNGLPEDKDVTQEHLMGIRDLANSGDWSNPDAIGVIFTRFCKIRGAKRARELLGAL